MQYVRLADVGYRHHLDVAAARGEFINLAAGLAEIPEDAGFVLVHDAARPLASPGLARAVIRRLAAGQVEGVIPAVPVRDALKRTLYDQVLETVDRTGLMIAQTPQGFVARVLREAHEQVAGDAPDDADLVGRNGGRVVVVPGEAANLKITFPGDLAVAEALLR